MESNFELFFPLLQSEIEKTPIPAKDKPKRTQVELLEEVLNSIRGLQNNKDLIENKLQRRKYFSIKGENYNLPIVNDAIAKWGLNQAMSTSGILLILKQLELLYPESNFSNDGLLAYLRSFPQTSNG